MLDLKFIKTLYCYQKRIMLQNFAWVWYVYAAKYKVSRKFVYSRLQLEAMFW